MQLIWPFKFFHGVAWCPQISNFLSYFVLPWKKSNCVLSSAKAKEKVQSFLLHTKA